MDLAARKAANLSVLRRQDPDIVDLLDQSSHAVVYTFDLSKAGWAKKGIEGTVFLIRRNTPPYYGIYILNRVSIDNYRLNLTEDLVIEQQDEYIIYQTPNVHYTFRGYMLSMALRIWRSRKDMQQDDSFHFCSMRDASKQTKVTKTTSIDVATLFGNASSVQQTSVQTTDPRNVSLDQLFNNASLNTQPAPPLVNPVGKSVNLAELFQSVNPPPKPQNVSGDPATGPTA
ncbi:hypothetical protein NQZ79_g8640 [Umbelopsis isabellina]|nr:hypothetical protein NQZ79_g8640 [Umbelopsis isabellina]